MNLDYLKFILKKRFRVINQEKFDFIVKKKKKNENSVIKNGVIEIINFEFLNLFFFTILY